MSERNVSVEDRLTEGRISELATLCQEIERETAKNPLLWPGAHRDTLRALFGALVGLCWGHPEAVARYIWRLNESVKGGADGSKS